MHPFIPFSSRSTVLCCAWLLLCVTLTACGRDGPELGYVEGVVTLDGRPVQGAVITFMPQDRTGTTSYGETDENGRYTLMYTFKSEGVLIGTHDVKIEKQQFSPEEIAEMKSLGMSVGDNVRIPAKYGKRGELTAEVEPGSNEINFTLLSE